MKMQASMAKPLTLKQWCAEEGLAQGVSEHAIYMRIRKGRYPHLALARHNKRLVFVTDGACPYCGNVPAKRDMGHDNNETMT